TPPVVTLQLAGYEAALPVSEKSNPITQELDWANPMQVVQLLKECDAKIFQEEEEALLNYKRLYSQSVLETMTDIISKAQEVLKDPENGLIVLSGSGTSGRLSFLIANSFNKLLKGLGQLPHYTYIIAGGDSTAAEQLLLSPYKKSPKARWKRTLGLVRSCRNHTKPSPPAVGVGSAPHQPWSPQGWHLIASLGSSLHFTRLFLIFDGPEGIRGFSWMKGGSATKILLEMVLLAAHKVSRESEIQKSECLVEILRTYERAHTVICAHSRKIAALVKGAGMSTASEGLYMVGWPMLGLIEIMNDVECIPAFGADSKDVQGFLIGDHNDTFNKEMDLIAQGPQFAFSQEDFVKIILPSLTELNSVLFLFTLDNDLAEVEKLVIQVKEKTSNIQALSHATVGQYWLASLRKLFPAIISIMWPILFRDYEGNFIQKFQQELNTKWILNTVSPRAHILKGKILCNCMVDLLIGSSKLFWRAVSILQRFTGHSQARCLDSLLQVICDSEVLLDDLCNKEISTHILVATEKNKVIGI
ncbi:Glucokinase regulatory protein, partial [Cathartes aura]